MGCLAPDATHLKLRIVAMLYTIQKRLSKNNRAPENLFLLITKQLVVLLMINYIKNKSNNFNFRVSFSQRIKKSPIMRKLNPE